jgi:hypothetical protein
MFLMNTYFTKASLTAHYVVPIFPELRNNGSKCVLATPKIQAAFPDLACIGFFDSQSVP